MTDVLLATAHWSMEADRGARVVTLRRTAEPFGSVAGVEAGNASVMACARAEHRSWGLVLDVRDEPSPHDAAVQTAMVRLREHLRAQFGRFAIVVKTSLEILHLKRIARERPARDEIFTTLSESDAVAFASGAVRGAPVPTVGEPATFGPTNGARGDLDRVREALRVAEAWRLDHVNPYELAERTAIDVEDVITALVSMERAGSLRVRFNTLCVYCGATETRFDRLAAAPTVFFRCELCDADISIRDGERIEVAFTAVPAKGNLPVDPFDSLAAYRRRFVSTAIVPSAEFAAYLARSLRGQAILGPREWRTFMLPLASGATLRAVSYDLHATARIRCVGAGRPSVVKLSAFAGGWQERAMHCAPGPLEIVVTNTMMTAMGVLLVEGESDEYHHVIGSHPPSRKPFLSAKDALARGIVA